MLALGALAGSGPAWAQAQEDQPIFRRFSSAPRQSATRLWLLEVPVALRPQTDPGATVDENLGLGYELGVQPGNRVFGSVAFSLGRMQWQPSDPAVASVDVKQFDMTQSLNFRAGAGVVIGLGLGLGLLDALVLNTDGSFEHTIVPYIPVRLGLAVTFGGAVHVGLRIATTPFFGEGHMAGQSRLLLALGWSG